MEVVGDEEGNIGCHLILQPSINLSSATLSCHTTIGFH